MAWNKSWDVLVGYNLWLYIPVPPQTTAISKCQRLNCIVQESNPGRPRCRRALYLKSCLHCKQKMTENSAVFFFVSTVLNFASTVLNFASTVFFFVKTVLNFESTKKSCKSCQRLNCIVRESNPGRPRCRRALYLKSRLHCKKWWRKTRLYFSSSVLC